LPFTVTIHQPYNNPVSVRAELAVGERVILRLAQNAVLVNVYDERPFPLKLTVIRGEWVPKKVLVWVGETKVSPLEG